MKGGVLCACVCSSVCKFEYAHICVTRRLRYGILVLKVF